MSLTGVLEVFVLPAIIGCTGVALIGLSFTIHEHTKDELRQVEGALLAYDSVRSEREDVVVLSIANQPSRFWTTAVTKETATATMFDCSWNSLPSIDPSMAMPSSPTEPCAVLRFYCRCFARPRRWFAVLGKEPVRASSAITPG